MPRKNVEGVMKLAPQPEKLMQSMDVSIEIIVPMAAEADEMMAVVYRFHSMDHYGESVDKMVGNEEVSITSGEG